MILATVIFAATLRYESILTKFDKPVFESGASKCALYAEGDVGGGKEIVAYGFTPVRRGSSPDVNHQIFVTMIARKGDAYEIVSARRTRTTYRPQGRSLVPEPPAAATKEKLTPLARVALKEIVPCCSGCELKE